jgi:DedD protein
MAFFKSKKGGEERTTPAPAAESVEAMRKRAKHRLIGAAVLVLLGVIGFPLLFDSQPRPVAVDIAIEIPDKNKVKPLVASPAVPPAAKPSAVIEERADPPKPAAAPVAQPAAPTAPVVAVAPVKPVVKPIEKAAEKPAEKAVEKAVDKPAEKPVAKPVDAGAKAQALLDGKEPEQPSASAGRFVVQVGAYSDVLKAREARTKLEGAGLKTYTQVVQPKEGKRIRVRVGPFESKADAEKIAEKIKKLDLPASILEL